MKKIVLLIGMFLVCAISLAQYRVATVGESKIFVMTNLDNDKEESYQREYIKADVNQLGNIVVTTAMGAGDGRPFAFSRTTGIPYTEFRDGNDSDATFANAAAVITWFRDNTGFKTAAGGSAALLGSGTVLDLSLYRQVDTDGANSATAYTISDGLNGLSNEVYINAASEPTVTGATKLPGTVDYTANSDAILNVFKFGDKGYYYFFVMLE